MPGTEPRGVSGLCQRFHALSLVASASQIAHGLGRSTSAESGAPPLPARRTKAMRVPSGDQRGEPSRAVAGAIQWIGVESLTYTPMNE